MTKQAIAKLILIPPSAKSLAPILRHSFYSSSSKIPIGTDNAIYYKKRELYLKIELVT